MLKIDTALNYNFFENLTCIINILIHKLDSILLNESAALWPS